ncbi:unnamed protein product, partial [Leptidea sinapis]
MSKIYRTIIAVADRFVPGPIRPLWNHPAASGRAADEELVIADDELPESSPHAPPSAPALLQE